jgi:hypothetical protein
MYHLRKDLELTHEGKKGDKTVATAGVIERPFAEAASAALLSVPC